ncbi:putative RNA methyltransferase, partial [Streptomyces olivaceus]
MPAVLPPALAPLLDTLRCPVCGAALRPAQGALRCPTGHTFNIARQGYVSLLTGARALSGDDTAMVQARTRFLATGTYAPVSQVLTHLAAEAVSTRGTVLDAGCGTGYYLAGVLDRLPTARGLGLDASVQALRSAARSHERAAAASWDVFRPFPLADQAVDVVLNVFAPRGRGGRRPPRAAGPPAGRAGGGGAGRAPRGPRGARGGGGARGAGGGRGR